MKTPEELSIVTEIGVFGDLDIEDPTSKKIDKKKKSDFSDIEDTINTAIKENLKTLEDFV